MVASYSDTTCAIRAGRLFCWGRNYYGQVGDGTNVQRTVPTEVDGLALLATASAHKKCGRCWHHRKDVGTDVTHPEICGRCVKNITTDGETRSFA